MWLMRQAGRYLPEYRRVREGVSFLEMCADVDRAVEVSLQPIDLVGSEAVILFSDIFVPIPAMGVDLDFQPGPTIEAPVRTLAQVEKLRVPDPRESVPFVFDILHALAASAGRGLSRDQLLQTLHGRDWAAYDRAVDVHTSRIRQKIEDDPKRPALLKTVRGVGYQLVRTEPS